MARHLDVYLHRVCVGSLSQDDYGDTGFRYADSWLGTPNHIPLSQSLPLRAEPFNRRECRGFFGGVLPEGEKREIIAGNLGISANNDVALLEIIGGECAGAVTFARSGASLPAQENGYRRLTEAALAEELRKLPRRPLLAGVDQVRLSLAGAQDKLAVCIRPDGIHLPLNGAPSTHIIKPAIERFPGIVRNELLCMRLAAAVGLQAAQATRSKAEDIEYLVVERYDRTLVASTGLERIHQEDFCQALGVISEQKYQAEGGPSFSICTDLLRRSCAAPASDILRFTDAFIFNFLIGNNDAHGKNFSLLYSGWPYQVLRTALAPLNDLVCTSYYSELSTRMAMRIGGEYEPDKVRGRHFDELAEEAKLSKAAFRRRVARLARLTVSKIGSLDTNDEVSRDLAVKIRQRCDRVLAIFER